MLSVALQDLEQKRSDLILRLESKYTVYIHRLLLQKGILHREIQHLFQRQIQETISKLIEAGNGNNSASESLGLMNNAEANKQIKKEEETTVVEHRNGNSLLLIDNCNNESCLYVDNFIERQSQVSSADYNSYECDYCYQKQ